MTYTRVGLREANAAEFAALVGLIETVAADRPDEAFTGEARDRNVRDVVAHLHAWHLLLERWHVEGSFGATPSIPAEGYTWRQLAELNEDLRQQWQHASLGEVLVLLKASHRSLQEMVARHTDAQLDDPQAYAWTNGTALGEFALECGGNHYAWGRGTIVAGLQLEE